MRSYYRVMLGRRSTYAGEAYRANFIGGGFIKDVDLTTSLLDNWRDFNKKFIPIFLEQNPDKTKISAGLACGMLWTIAKGISEGDIVLSPDGSGSYYVGEAVGPYRFVKDHELQHQRPVRWYSRIIKREEMSEALRNSTGSIGTISDISRYAGEIEKLLKEEAISPITSTEETVENYSEFALEKHLEDFLIQNWEYTEIGKSYDIYEEGGEVLGQQYPSDTGPIDILAMSKDKKVILVVELKRGRASDVVVGQVQRYMGYVKEEIAQDGQGVQGLIIAFEDDIKIRRALSVTQNIDFYTYKIQFKLEKK